MGKAALGFKPRTGRAVLVVLVDTDGAPAVFERAEVPVLPPGEFATYHAAAALVAMLALSGCDNFSESVSTESWKSSAITEAPAPAPAGFEGGISTTVVGEGTGPQVKAGDLVHLRYTRTVTWANNTEHAETPSEAWVWTGREPDPNTELWGKFGSPEFRTVLIGRKVGEKFELRVVTEHRSITAPRYGIAGPNAPRKGHNQFIGQYGEMEPKVLAIGPLSTEPRSWSLVEIVATCPAKFATRMGHMKQWGYVANPFRTAWDASRSGDLKWSAIEAKCPAPEGDVRFMLGPIYWTAEPVVPGMLMAWETTYRTQHSREMFPADYAFVTINGRTLPTKP